MSQDSPTLRDIYNAVNSLDAKWDKRMEKTETKVEKLESNQDKAFGILAVFSVFSGFISKFVWEKITGVK